MKKVLCFVLLLVTFAQCIHEDPEIEVILDDRLVGTKWETRATREDMIFGGTNYDVYEFISTSRVRRYIIKEGKIVHSDGVYIYALDYPRLFIEDSERKEVVFNFKDSKTFIRYGAKAYESYVKYVRQ
jgi:hypothetical protein